MKAPDLNAPRFRYKFAQTLSLTFIKSFKLKYPQYAQYKDQDLISALKEHNRLITEHTIESRDGVELHAGMGTVFISTVPTKKSRPIAYKKSIELGMKVYHKNWDTDNKMAKIHYVNFNTKYKFALNHLWTFTPVRQYKRRVSVEYPKQWRKYILMDNTISLWDIFNKREYKDKARSRQKEDLQTYSEFDI